MCSAYGCREIHSVLLELCYASTDQLYPGVALIGFTAV